MTTDFTGSYDWAEEEALIQAQNMLESFEEGYYRSQDELHQAIIKTRNHWIKVFGSDEQGFKDMQQFAEVFNSKCFEKFNIAM